MLCKDKDRLIRYNYLKVVATREESQTYKLPESKWAQKIQEAQVEDLDLEQYKNQEAIYIPQLVVKEFVIEFYKGII